MNFVFINIFAFIKILTNVYKEAHIFSFKIKHHKDYYKHRYKLFISRGVNEFWGTYILEY